MPSWVEWVGRGVLVAIALLLAWRLFDVCLMVALALLIAAAFSPVVRWLDDHRMPHVLSASLCFLALISTIATLFYFVVPMLIRQAIQLSESAPYLADQFQLLRDRWAGWKEQVPLIPSFDDMVNWASGLSRQWALWTLGLASNFLSLFFKTISVLFLAFFFLLEGDQILAQVLKLFPQVVQREAPPLIRRINDQVGHWVLGQLAEMTFVGLMVGLGFAFLGVPYPALMGALAFALDIVPYVGPIAAAIPGILLALTQSWQLALWALGFYVVVQQIEAYVLNPFVVGRFIGMRPVYLLLAILIGTSLLGILGMLLAVPAAVILQILLVELYLPWRKRHPGPS
jgi:predicted PurR-regulated permease PerM